MEDEQAQGPRLGQRSLNQFFLSPKVH